LIDFSIVFNTLFGLSTNGRESAGEAEAFKMIGPVGGGAL
jgi:hypothetical protein